MTWRGWVISMTRAGPIVAASGISSTPAAWWMKCTGPSMWVPLCTPMARWDRLQSCPRPISIDRCMTMGGLSGQCGMPCLTVTDTSIHAALAGFGHRRPGLRPSLAPFPRQADMSHAHERAEPDGHHRPTVIMTRPAGGLPHPPRMNDAEPGQLGPRPSRLTRRGPRLTRRGPRLTRRGPRLTRRGPRLTRQVVRPPAGRARQYHAVAADLWESPSQRARPGARHARRGRIDVFHVPGRLG